MSTLRFLSVTYLLAAAVFSIAILFEREPSVERASRASVRAAISVIRDDFEQPGVRLAREGTKHFVAEVVAATVAGELNDAFGSPVRLPVAPFEVSRTPSVAPHQAAAVSRSRPVARPSAAREEAGIDRAELIRVSARLHDNLSRDMLKNFGLFLYVSKADKGPWAQRLFVFRKDADQKLDLLYNWPASTGREKFERAPDGTRQHSITPVGYYQLDPERMYRKHFSGQWHEPMPYAMFFNWENHGYRTGVAIHAATLADVPQLGSRASAGCIRIAPQNARRLFDLIRSQYKGAVPRFAIDARTATMSNRGVLMHDGAGNVEFAQGYRVLVFVEDYGGEDVVAALY